MAHWTSKQTSIDSINMYASQVRARKGITLLFCHVVLDTEGASDNTSFVMINGVAISVSSRNASKGMLHDSHRGASAILMPDTKADEEQSKLLDLNTFVSENLPISSPWYEVYADSYDELLEELKDIDVRFQDPELAAAHNFFVKSRLMYEAHHDERVLNQIRSYYPNIINYVTQPETGAPFAEWRENVAGVAPNKLLMLNAMESVDIFAGFTFVYGQIDNDPRVGSAVVAVLYYRAQPLLLIESNPHKAGFDLHTTKSIDVSAVIIPMSSATIRKAVNDAYGVPSSLLMITSKQPFRANAIIQHSSAVGVVKGIDILEHSDAMIRPVGMLKEVVQRFIDDETICAGTLIIDRVLKKKSS